MNQQVKSAIAVALKLGLITRRQVKKITDFLSLAAAIRSYTCGQPLVAHMANFSLARAGISFEQIIWGGVIEIFFAEQGDYVRATLREGLTDSIRESYLADISYCVGRSRIIFTPRDREKMTVYQTMLKLGGIIKVIDPLRSAVAEDSNEENVRARRLLRI